MPDFDPFEPGTSGYDPNNFYTSHGDRATEAKEVKVKFDPVLWDIIHKLYIAAEAKFGDYTSIHEFIADCVFHRHKYLLTEYKHWLEDNEEMLRLTQVWEARAAANTATQRVNMRIDAMERIIHGIEMSADEKQWADPDTLVTLLAEGENLLGSLNERQQARLLSAVRAGERKLKELEANNQMELTKVIEQEEDMVVFDPFVVDETGPDV